jgi:hypothetical protein
LNRTEFIPLIEPMGVQCPNPDCRQLFFVDESRLGRKGGCSVCGQIFPLQAGDTTQTGESFFNRSISSHQWPFSSSRLSR